MTADNRAITRSDIEEIKADGKATLSKVDDILQKFTIHDTAQRAFEDKVNKLDGAIFGDGTQGNPGHISATNQRLDAIEKIQSSYTKAIWAIVTPLLSLLGLGIIFIIIQAATR